MKKKIIKGIVLSITVSVFLFALTTPTKAVEEEPDWALDEVLREFLCGPGMGYTYKSCVPDVNSSCDRNLETDCLID